MIDKLMKKFGYELTTQSPYGAYYERKEKGYTHILCVLHKQSGHHMVQSYDSNAIRSSVDGHWMCECCGIEIPVLLLLWLKARVLSCVYHWKKGVYTP